MGSVQSAAAYVADNDIISAGYRNDTSGVQAYEAGENITAGNVVYVKRSDCKAYVSDLATQDDRRAIGIAINSALSTETVYVQTTGRYQTTGLTASTTYYLGNSGALSSTFARVRIGYAISTTELNLDIDDCKGIVDEVRMFRLDLSGDANLTAYWQLCDGTTISDAESPLNGDTVRDMNGNNEFARAADTAGGTGGAATHTHTLPAPGSSNIQNVGPYSATTNPASSLPPYVDHVFAICKK